MEEVYTSRGASRHQINLLAEWVKENVGRVECGNLDIIRFIEIDLQVFFPGIYVEIKRDADMGRSRACISHDPLGICISETIYNLACENNISASETILHEVGHLFLHRDYAAKGLNDASGYYKPQFRRMEAVNSVEWQAKFFALCMLFPYSRMKQFSKRWELQVLFDLSVIDADRALEHTRKLRISEAGRNNRHESRWLQDVTRNLRRSRPIVEKYKIEQLSLFYRSERELCKPAL